MRLRSNRILIYFNGTQIFAWYDSPFVREIDKVQYGRGQTLLITISITVLQVSVISTYYIAVLTCICSICKFNIAFYSVSVKRVLLNGTRIWCLAQKMQSNISNKISVQMLVEQTEERLLCNAPCDDATPLCFLPFIQLRVPIPVP